MSSCRQDSLTDACVAPLRLLRHLDASYCTQLALSEETLESFAGRRAEAGGLLRPLESLRLDFCTQETLLEGCLWRMRGAVRLLSARGCRQLSERAQRGWTDRLEAAAAADDRPPLA